MPFVRRKTASKIRKTHRYFGLFIGLQFLLWTLSGIYFSWTDIDEIHGDHLRKENKEIIGFSRLKSPSEILPGQAIESAVLKAIAGEPYYWINNSVLVHAQSGKLRKGISEAEALAIAKENVREDLQVKHVEKINSTGKHHEYRGGALPAYVISYEGPENIKAYVSSADGSFKSLRHRDWRWFDFLWMTHTMDYESRDNFNSLVLRAFSVLGLLTVLSGFLLWFISSPTLLRMTKRKNSKGPKK